MTMLLNSRGAFTACLWCILSMSLVEAHSYDRRLRGWRNGNRQLHEGASGPHRHDGGPGQKEQGPSCGKKEASCMPSAYPSESPSPPPSISTSPTVTAAPSTAPSTCNHPSSVPSYAPTGAPSSNPSSEPSQIPSSRPSAAPTVSRAPSSYPSDFPTDQPSTEPSAAPSPQPSTSPSGAPTITSAPTTSMVPSVLPSVQPSLTPSVSFMPSLDPGGFDTVLVGSSPVPVNGTQESATSKSFVPLASFSSSCRYDSPDVRQQQQLVRFEYLLEIESSPRRSPSEAAQLAVDGIEIKLQRELAHTYLTCGFNEDDDSRSYHVVNLESAPADKVLESVDCVGTRNDTLCFKVETAFTASVLEPSNTRTLEKADFDVSLNAYDTYTTFLEQAFAGKSLYGARIVGTKFSYLYTSSPTMSPQPTSSPVIMGVGVGAGGAIPSGSPGSSGSPAASPTSDASGTERGIGAREGMDPQTRAILWYVLAIVSFVLICSIFLCVRRNWLLQNSVKFGYGQRPPPDNHPTETKSRGASGRVASSGSSKRGAGGMSVSREYIGDVSPESLEVGNGMGRGGITKVHDTATVDMSASQDPPSTVVRAMLSGDESACSGPEDEQSGTLGGSARRQPSVGEALSAIESDLLSSLEPSTAENRTASAGYNPYGSPTGKGRYDDQSRNLDDLVKSLNVSLTDTNYNPHEEPDFDVRPTRAHSLEKLSFDPQLDELRSHSLTDMKPPQISSAEPPGRRLLPSLWRRNRSRSVSLDDTTSSSKYSTTLAQAPESISEARKVNIMQGPVEDSLSTDTDIRRTLESYHFAGKQLKSNEPSNNNSLGPVFLPTSQLEDVSIAQVNEAVNAMYDTHLSTSRVEQL